MLLMKCHFNEPRTDRAYIKLNYKEAKYPEFRLKLEVDIYRNLHLS
jgi:hypothetical protein